MKQKLKSFKLNFEIIGEDVEDAYKKLKSCVKELFDCDYACAYYFELEYDNKNSKKVD